MGYFAFFACWLLLNTNEAFPWFSYSWWVGGFASAFVGFTAQILSDKLDKKNQ